jgi:hypothetical protein
VHELNLGPVDFELDSEIVVDNFHSEKDDVTEFEKIVAHFRRLFSFFILTLVLSPLGNKQTKLLIT